MPKKKSGPGANGQPAGKPAGPEQVKMNIYMSRRLRELLEKEADRRDKSMTDTLGEILAAGLGDPAAAHRPHRRMGRPVKPVGGGG